MAQIKLDGMLAATFFATIFYSATYPYIHQEIMRVAPPSVLAAQQIVNCLGVMFFGRLWNKKSDALFRFYPVYCVVETVCGVGSTVYVILTGNVVAYYMLDTVIFSVVTRNIICGGLKLKAIRYNTEELRERFDNNNNSTAALATMIGSVIAITLKLNFRVMICIATFGNAIDNAFYICIYLNHLRETRSPAP